MAATQGKGEDREQQIMLATALKVVRDQSLLMQRAMDGGDANLKITLDYATEMLRELRSNTLTPKNYYELYMSILDQMRYLEEYFRYVRMIGKKGRCCLLRSVWYILVNCQA